MIDIDATESRPGVLDDGFNVLARDLDRAFSLGLSTNQAAIMNSVREQSWTASLLLRRKGEPRPAPVPARINLTHLSGAIGLNRTSLSLALKALVSARILTRAGQDFLINKDYSAWLDDAGAKPRFTRLQLSYIRAAKLRKDATEICRINNQLPLRNATVGKNQSDEINNQLPLQNATATADHENGIDMPIPLQNATATADSSVAFCNSEAPKVLQNTTVGANGTADHCCETQQQPGQVLQNTTATVAKRNSAICERAHGVLDSEIEKADAAFARDDQKPDVKPFDMDLCPPFPTPGGPLEILPGGIYPMSQDQARKIFRMLWGGFGSVSICHEFYERQSRFPFDIWVAAIRHVKRKGISIGRLGYIEPIACEFMVKGIPPEVSMKAPSAKYPTKPRHDENIHRAAPDSPRRKLEPKS